MMLEFKGLNYFRNHARGLVILVASDRRYERDNPEHLLHQQVKIDGFVYTVKSIDSPAIGTVREGMEIGLLVEPIGVH